MLLMHKNIPVAEIKTIGNYISIQKLYEREHLPVGTDSNDMRLVDRKMQNWMAMRSIPRTRQDRRIIEQAVGGEIDKGMRLSLTDGYWLKEEENEQTWEHVDFHRNGFCDEMSKWILGKEKETITDLRIPDFTTDGDLKKVWVMDKGVPSLVKFGIPIGESKIIEKGKNLLSANEVVASHVAEKMGLSHVEYRAFPVGEEVACVCSCFIEDDSVEFVNLQQLIYSRQGMTASKSYDMLCDMGYKRETDQMILFDYLLHNTDRHEKNLGLIRNADTLEYIGFAPLFDNGSCLGWDYDPKRPENHETKPFRRTREDQLELAKGLSMDIPEMKEIANIVKETYEIFQIPEANYRIAVMDLGKTYDSLVRQNLIFINRNEESR